jgi:hypothetical protein
MKEIKVYKYRIKGVPTQLSAIQEYMYESHFYLNELRKIGMDQRRSLDSLLADVYPEMLVAQQTVQENYDAYHAANDQLKKQNQADGRAPKSELAQQVAQLEKVAKSSLTAFYKLKKDLKKQLTAEVQTSAAELDADYLAYKTEYDNMDTGLKARSKRAVELRQKMLDIVLELGVTPQRIENIAKLRTQELTKSSTLSGSQTDYLKQSYSQCLKKGKLHLDESGDSNSLYIRTQHQKDIPHRFIAEDLRLPGKKRYVAAKLLVSPARGKQVWSEFTIVLHRPLPDGRLCGISLVKTRIATKIYWEIHFQCEVERVLHANNNDPVGFDLGWRMLDEGLHVASWYGCHGQGHLILPKKKVEEMDFITTMQSQRDTVFEGVMAMLLNWVHSHKVPEWVSNWLQHAHSWKSQDRLVKLLQYWQHNRFSGDSVVYSLLNGDGHKHPRYCRGRTVYSYGGWRNWDKHKYERICQQRQKWIRWRRDLYNNLASRLCKVYGIFKFEDACMKQLDRKSKSTEENNDRIRHCKWMAAPGLFRDLMKQHADHWQYVESRGTTAMCNDCGTWIDFGSSLHATCPLCEKFWDRDENAARNVCQSTNVVKEYDPEKKSNRHKKKAPKTVAC